MTLTDEQLQAIADAAAEAGDSNTRMRRAPVRDVDIVDAEGHGVCVGLSPDVAEALVAEVRRARAREWNADWRTRALDAEERLALPTTPPPGSSSRGR